MTWFNLQLPRFTRRSVIFPFPANLPALIFPALKGSADARSNVWHALGGCGEDLANVKNVALEGDVQTFDWDRLAFSVNRSAVTLGPLPAEQTP